MGNDYACSKSMSFGQETLDCGGDHTVHSTAQLLAIDWYVKLHRGRNSGKVSIRARDKAWKSVFL